MQRLNDYKKALIESIENLEHNNISRLVDRITETSAAGGTVFVAGNGGSAATSSHFVCDLQKTVLGKDPFRNTQGRIRIMSLTDNIPSITAWSNDQHFKHIFSEPLRSYARSGDMLLVITGSGNSENIIEVLKAAKELEIASFGLLGFSGGAAKDILDDFIIVESNHYGVVEDAHSIIMHMVTELLKGNYQNE